MSQPVPSDEQPVLTDEEPKTTPLIEYLRTQKAARAEKEKINREKMRLAKIAVVQAKANAQSAKLRAEKMQKAEDAGDKPVEPAKQIVPRGGTRGGKSAGKGKDASQRVKVQQQQQQQQQQQRQKAKEGPSTTSVGEISTSDPTVNPVPPQETQPASTPMTSGTANSGGGIGGRVFRGGRGRGRGRTHGVYRQGGGRGGRRGGGPGVDGRTPTAVAE